MTRALTVALLALLSACMTLPGSDTPAFSRYTLQGPEKACDSGGEPLVLSVARANVGLDSDRIARRNTDTGEISYLKDVRWADQAGILVEQQLARDLECQGFTVLSSHHHKLGQRRLICELRALNLVESGDRDSADVGLSCMLYGPDADTPFVSSHQVPLARWSARSAVAATSEAYRKVLADLVAALQ